MPENPEIQKLYSDLETEIDNKIRSFLDRKQKELEYNFQKELQRQQQTKNTSISDVIANKGATEPPVTSNPSSVNPSSVNPSPANQMKNLPWFANGIKGFLRKLWHGNSKTNPDWSMTESVTLEEYSFIKNELEDILLETDILNGDDVKILVSNLMISIRTYLDRLKKIKRAYNKRKQLDNSSSDGSKELSPPEPIAPAFEKASESKPTEKTYLVTPSPKIGKMKIDKSKASKEPDAPQTFEQMKISDGMAAKVAKSIIPFLMEIYDKFGHDKLTSEEKQKKRSLIKEFAGTLEAIGIEIINGDKIARTRENAVKLVQILKAMNKLDELYDWTMVDNYFDTFPDLVYPNMKNYIEEAIENIKKEPEAEVKSENRLEMKFKQLIK